MGRPPASKTADDNVSSSSKPRPSAADIAREHRRLESGRAASQCYCEKNRDKVLEAGRLRAAARRMRQQDNPKAKARAREASARYRERNCEELALQQRQVRKKAFIKKHGLYVHLKRGFAAPPAREPDLPSPGPDDGGDGDTPERYHDPSSGWAAGWWDNNPCLKRW
ncbi:hypothetical protein DFH08DRAFT_949203 [Mycena albidolilacea]|uniref:Uncharacterized protein n=1 Tax=Mycena albidolilacea TaxID=1033008 RepID=A0AAD7AST8_9AGAR|nr:hypothetical protein DFH08DRAFT_949203 [Mycena albidolilacea]